MPGMNLKMNQNSIFAILLRSPWWVSAGVAAAIFALGRALIPEEYSLYAVFLCLPFAVIAVHTLWHQLRAPSQASIATRLDALRELSWPDFCTAVEDGFRRDGYAVNRISRNGADLELVKSGRVTLVGCKRWKVARTGIEPLRELESARLAHDAHESIYIAGGEITDTARAYSAEAKIRLIDGAGLAQLLPRIAAGTGKPQATR